MKADQDIERLLDRWLADGPEEVADRVLDRALDIVRQTSQRRVPGAPWRYVPVSLVPRLAAAAAVVILAGAGLILAVGLRGASSTVGGPPAPTALPTPAASASPTPAAPSPSGTAAAAVDSAFAARAAAICGASKQAFASSPPFPYPSFDATVPSPVSDLPGIGAYFAKYGAPIWTGSLHQLQALGEPVSGRQAWDSFMNLLVPFVATQAQQVADAKAGNASAFVATVNWLSGHRAAADEAATVAGVAVCGP
jgi:hypothetical protein